MTYLLITLHIVVCIALIIIVLLQAGKGAEIGASFGAGASNTVFGASGGKNFMSRMTAAVAIVFMLTSLVLAYFWGKPGSSSVMPEAVAPVAAPAPAAPPATVPRRRKKPRRLLPASRKKINRTPLFAVDRSTPNQYKYQPFSTGQNRMNAKKISYSAVVVELVDTLA